MTKLPLIKIKHMLLKSTIKIFLMGRNHWFLSSTVTILKVLGLRGMENLGATTPYKALSFINV